LQISRALDSPSSAAAGCYTNNMIKAVIFDCFGVLYADPGLLFYEANVPNFSDLKSAIMDIDKQSDYGYITQEQHDQAIAELTGLEYEVVHKGVHSTHSRNEPLLEFSQQLRADYRLGMLSNIGRGGMESFFSAAEQDALFDAVVLSSDIGMIKPSVEVFEETARRLGVSVGECIMIDDRRDNCAGADAAGMQSVLHIDTQTTIAEVSKLLNLSHA